MNKFLLQIKRCFKYSLIIALASGVTFSAAAQQTKSPAQMNLSFSSQVIFGAQKNNLAIVVSSDFNGEHTMDGIKKASWTDITDQFQLADTKDWKKSGEADLSKFMVQGKPLYIGLRYIGKSSTVGPTQKMWGIREMYLNNTELPSADWKIVNDPNNFNGAEFTRPKAGGILFRSNQSITRSESWGIVKIK